MFQTSIEEYTKLVDLKLGEYLASLPDPVRPIKEYIEEMPKDDNCTALPIEWFDVAAMTALIRNHKDSKDKYEVNSYLVEMLTTMFRVAVHKLHWLEDDRAFQLASYLAYDTIVDTEEYKLLINDFCQACKMFPYSIENQAWYNYLMPLLAYTKQSKFNRSNYLARYMVATINRYGIMENRGEHIRDINVDQLRPIPNLAPLLDMCRMDNTHTKDRYEYCRNILCEFATVFLSCLLRRSAIHPDFGKISGEIAAYHYLTYQEISQIYFNKKQEKEK